MGYIRSNEDYYRHQGLSEKEVKVQIALDKARLDYGTCNPLKAKRAAEAEEEIRRKVESE